MEEAQIVVDVEASRLSKSMQRKLNKLWGEPNEIENFTIFRAPRNMHQSKKNLFEPSVISIGPFHHGQTSLRAMEEQKWRFLRDFLSRGDHISLDLCISAMKLLEERTRRCYSETVDLDSNGFVEMMLLDGCFVLEYFFKREAEKWYSTFEVGWNHVYVDWDLVLLENQIPFFVVEKLCEIGVKQEDRLNFVNDIIHNMFPPIPNYPLIPNPPDKIDHLAHLYHHCSVPKPVELSSNLEEPVELSSNLEELVEILSSKLEEPVELSSNLEEPVELEPVELSSNLEEPVELSSKSFHLTRMLSPNRIKNLLLWFLSWLFTRFPDCTSPGNPSMMVIPCATNLQDAGMKFRPKRKPKHMFDISFDHGVLEIPRLTITDDSRPLFVNLIALEQCKFGKMYAHFTSFATFLDSLVNTQKDVMILQQCGIIESWLSGEEDLTHFFNQLNEGTVLENDHFLAELFTEVNRYFCESSWNRHRAKLIRDYFSSPWTTISLVAALVLLVLTCVQSYFAVYAYYVPPS